MRVIVAVLLLIACYPAHAQEAEPKRVLIVHSFGRDFAPYSAIGLTLRTELSRILGGPVVFHEISLDAERGVAQADELPLVEYLAGRNAAAPPDLVVAIAAPAMHFCVRHRERLYPGRALLVTGIDRRRMREVEFDAADRAVTVDLDFPRFTRDAMALKPDTKTLALALGASPLERFWAAAIESEVTAAVDSIHVMPPEATSLEQMRRRVSALPADSAVLYFMYAVGTDGVHHETDVALHAISEASNAPVFGLFADQLGKGIVGGSLLDTRVVGNATAELAARMLRGEAVAAVETLVPPNPPAFDQRELDRWQIPMARLPAGAIVKFRTPTAWEEHRLPILVGTAVVLLQAALIAALLLQRGRRRQAEQVAESLSGRLLTAHEDERRRLARELHDDLTQRLARLAIDTGRMELAPAAPQGLRPLREDLVRLSEDVHSLSYRLHPSVLDDLGLIEALRTECDRSARQGSLQVRVDASGVPASLSADASLCLFRIAQEALNNAVRHSQATAVIVQLSPSGNGLCLTVSDNGRGFDARGPRRHGSLGLASMRERVRILRGKLDIESAPGRGTIVIAWVPA